MNTNLSQSGANYSAARVGAAVTMGLGVALAVTAIWVIASFLPQRKFSCDFSLAYLPARIAREGGDVYTASLTAYNDANGLPFNEKMGPTTNPPLLVWFFRPLTGLAPATAFWVWTMIEVLSVVAILTVCCRLLGRRLSGAGWALAIGLWLCSLPMFAHFWFGQVQLPLAALVMTGFFMWRRGAARWAVVVFALAGVLKVFPLTVAPLPALGARGRKQLELLAVLLGSIAALVALSGWRMWISFARSAAPFLETLAAGGYYNFTVTAFIAELSGARMGRLVGGTASVLLIVFGWLRGAQAMRRGVAEAEESSFCLLLVSSVMCSVIAWTHYLVVLIYPMLLLVAHARETRGRTRWVATGLLAAAVLTFNTAGTNFLKGFAWPLPAIGAAMPLFVMLLLYVYFALRLTAGR